MFRLSLMTICGMEKLEIVFVKIFAPVDGLPQEEPLFTLNQYPTKVLKDSFVKSRNIIVVKKGKKPDFLRTLINLLNHKNVFFISGTDTEDVLNVLEEKSAEIIKTIKSC